jgi:hypothetical protein
VNLSRLRQLVSEGDCSVDTLRFLINSKNECEWLDYKENLSFESDFELSSLAKDIVGIKNVGGGYLVIGVKDKSWDPIGIPTPLQFDSKKLRDKVRLVTGLDIEVDIVSHKILIYTEYRDFAIIFIRGTNKKSKMRTPSVLKKDFCLNEKYCLRKGEIYFRKGDSTVKLTTQEELENLLSNIENEIDNNKVETLSNWSPFAIEDGLYRLLEKGFEHFVGREELRKKLKYEALSDPRIWIINVHGPGGVGKSAVVNWVTHEFYKSRVEYEAILQLTAKETVLTESGIDRFKSRTLYSLENFLDHILILFSENPPSNLAEKKRICIEYLSAFKSLIILDNMETVSDGRILEFIQKLPISNQSKFLITSRFKTGGWEQST